MDVALCNLKPDAKSLFHRMPLLNSKLEETGQYTAMKFRSIINNHIGGDSDSDDSDSETSSDYVESIKETEQEYVSSIVKGEEESNLVSNPISEDVFFEFDEIKESSQEYDQKNDSD